VFEDPSLNLYRGVSPGYGMAFSIGAVNVFKFSSLFSLVPELQYSFYSGSKEFTVDSGTKDFETMHEVYAYLHTIEIPVMARFSIGSAYYAEVGPQVGFNIYSKIYKDNQPVKPSEKLFAFGPSVGGGYKINEATSIGGRFYFGILEYAENSNGYPWAVQASLTTILF
jgi:hypothetical protein